MEVNDSSLYYDETQGELSILVDINYVFSHTP